MQETTKIILINNTILFPLWNCTPTSFKTNCNLICSSMLIYETFAADPVNNNNKKNEYKLECVRK